jgi:transaldolase/glucose-6-phosphate isomerase
MYLEELIGPDTVNTVPPTTLAAFLDHGSVTNKIQRGVDLLDGFFEDLHKVSISIERVTEELEKEGVQAFSDAYNKLVGVIESRRQEVTNALGTLKPKIKNRLDALENERFQMRLFNHDPLLWTKSEAGQKEIIQRLDWLEAPWKTEGVYVQTNGLLRELKQEGFTHALILGMGGSSLAPEVFSVIHGSDGKGLIVSILDSTHPEEVLAKERSLPLDKTIFIVSSKSGTTGEINAFFNYFYEKMTMLRGSRACAPFLAITDPETKLARLAVEKKFRKVILANPKVGGRNSALTAFGLVPAELIGLNTVELIKRVLYNAKWFLPDQPVTCNPGIVLGTILAEAAIGGMDKLSILADPEWVPFGAWMEQLIAESSGKEGKGILPIAGEPLVIASNYHPNRLFVYLRKNGDYDKLTAELQDSGHPVVKLDVSSSYDLGYQFYLWEGAIATACSILGINSFDQPDVQDAKTRTLAGIESYRKTGQFVTDLPIIKNEEFSVYTRNRLAILKADSPLDVIREFLKTYGDDNSYVAINAFVHRDPENIQKLTQLRELILNEFDMANTLGFGPRFLHSTGQLHKGGPDNGLFIMLTDTPSEDIAIPGEGITFGKFCFAQALGDESALINRGRKVLRIHFHRDYLKF